MESITKASRINNAIQVIVASSGKVISETITDDNLMGYNHPESIGPFCDHSLYWSLDGSYFLTVPSNPTTIEDGWTYIFKTWDTSTGNLISLYALNETFIYAPAWFADGKWLAATSKEASFHIKFFHPTTGEIQGSPVVGTMHTGNEWSLNGHWLLASEQGEYFLYDLENGEIVSLVPPEVSQNQILRFESWLPDGNRFIIISSNPGAAWLYDATNEQWYPLEHVNSLFVQPAEGVEVTVP